MVELALLGGFEEDREPRRRVVDVAVGTTLEASSTQEPVRGYGRADITSTHRTPRGGYATCWEGAAARRAGTSRSWRGPRGARLACEVRPRASGPVPLGSDLQVLAREDAVRVLHRRVLG